MSTNDSPAILQCFKTQFPTFWVTGSWFCSPDLPWLSVSQDSSVYPASLTPWYTSGDLFSFPILLLAFSGLLPWSQWKTQWKSCATLQLPPSLQLLVSSALCFGEGLCVPEGSCSLFLLPAFSMLSRCT